MPGDGRFQLGSVPWNKDKSYTYIIIDKDTLRDLYLSKNMTLLECANELNCSNTTIRKWLNIYNIPKRTMTKKKNRVYNNFKGKHHTEESKEKIRQSKLGTTLSEETKQKMSDSKKGKKLSEAHIENIRISNLGNKSHFWKGGISLLSERIRGSSEYIKWRQQIFERDNYTCQRCNSCGEINAHHIDYFSDIIEKNNITTFEDALSCELLWDTSNGITLCTECHMKLHYGGETCQEMDLIFE